MRKVLPIIHFGRKAPKGFEEVGGGVHLGRGLWMLNIKPIKPIKKTRGGKK